MENNNAVAAGRKPAPGEKPDMGFWKLWNLSFGFFGVQIAYALQSSQVSRIFSTIGADPHDLSYFWILPPLMGMIVQPIVGVSSDRTWNRFGRRLPYLILGALVAMIVMCFLPNAGSLGLSIGAAIIFGLVMLMFLDTSINMAMQPFKMLVGDFVNERQKGLAYSIQSFLCNAGSVVGYLAPFVLAWFLPTTAPEGEVPPTVTVAFYLGAAILLLCVIYTMAKVKEMPPKEYAYYHGIVEKPQEQTKKEKVNLIKLLANAPKVFWTVGVVQFFCWAAFLYMWTFSTDAVAIQAFDAPSQKVVESVRVNGQNYSDKYLFNGKQMVLDNGKFVMAGVNIDGNFTSPSTVTLDGDTIIKDGQPVYVGGVAKIAPHSGALDLEGHTLAIEGQAVEASRLTTVSQFALVEPGTILTLAHIAKADGKGEYFLEDTQELPALESATSLDVSYKTVLNSASAQYQAAGDWNGVLLAIQGGVAVLWALLLARFRNRKVGYSLSLLIGAVGFLSICFIQNKYLLCVSYGLAGCGWAAMLAMPFTILTNALSGKNIGAYLGLFNCTICLPQIIAAIVGGLILNLFPIVTDGASTGVANTVMMLGTSGVLMLLGSLAVWIIRETSGEHVVKAE